MFTSIPHLINQLKECRSEKTLTIFNSKFEKYDLIIADELGYISFDKEGSELLFSNLSLTAAMIDRLTHKAYIVNMNGNSYRLKETQTMLEENG